MTGFVERNGEAFLRFGDIGLAMAVLGTDGALVGATHAAVQLLRRFQLPVEPQATLPAKLAKELASAPLGEAIMWRHPSTDIGAVLGCTRYSLGTDHLLLVMREITEQQRALARRLHQQRLESTGRLISQIAHDLRAPLASIIYNVDLLREETHLASSELLHDVTLAANTLRDTIAGLLDFARLGPPAATTQTLGKLFERVSGLLRPTFRAGGHELSIALHDDSVCVRGNAIAIEQIFHNLLVNATESRRTKVRVRITSEETAMSGVHRWRTDRLVIVRVHDDGPGVPEDRREAVFDEFYTTKPDGTGLGLTVAREAAIAFGGGLTLEPSDTGCCFAVALPVYPRSPTLPPAEDAP
ncbi:MAG: HAMP domain-containing histidine kinase [Deltaproteobacteria bacterium]|nr:HAMP domain-containing histidine kinase [Deltaproteobacteria bacterium]MCW5807312.1 HAMP domain-containing histidine kinase [Deltaproteobacteria bacterium]